MLSSKHSSTNRLAFIIPAYKERFLATTLASLAEQTDQNFSVYIGDDDSPDNLPRIIEPFRDKLRLHYRRFNDNLGHNSLVQHWERCVDLSTEEYFCLLGDDDVIDCNCVAEFYTDLNETNERYDVYKFSNAIIDEHGNLISYGANSSRTETHMEFLYNRLRLRRISFMSAYIVCKEAYHREKGFVDFPLAWFSDDASIIQFSQLTGIRGISGAQAYWRLSGQNISSANESTYWTKIEATLKYLKWFSAKLNNEVQGHNRNNSKEHRVLIERWFFHNLDYYGCYRLSLVKLLKVSAAICPYCESNTIALFFKLYSQIRKKQSNQKADKYKL